MGYALTDLRVGESLTAGVCPEAIEGITRLGDGYLDEVVQPLCGKSLSQRALKNSHRLESFNHRFILSMLTDVEGGFSGYAKQADSIWLKICLFELFFNWVSKSLTLALEGF